MNALNRCPPSKGWAKKCPLANTVFCYVAKEHGSKILTMFGTRCILKQMVQIVPVSHGNGALDLLVHLPVLSTNRFRLSEARVLFERNTKTQTFSHLFLPLYL